MKEILIFLLAILCLLPTMLIAQETTTAPCGINSYESYLTNHYANWTKERLRYEEQVKSFLTNKTVEKSNEEIINIPVVLHVLTHSTTPHNEVTDELAAEIIEQLNIDFSNKNPDTVNIPPPFKHLAANAYIQFCLAQQDANGIPTSGIERRVSEVAAFTEHNQVKSYETGGLAAWNVTKYLNIWICDIQLGNGVQAYAIKPTATPSDFYGIVIDRGWVGAGIHTLTHEVGHALNLAHLWGDIDSPACISDNVEDTPAQQNSSGCFTFPFVGVCSPDANGRMFTNYMDYSSCKNMFTYGQVERMRAVLQLPPYDALATSVGCQVPTIYPDDVSAAAVLFPKAEICNQTTIVPNVIIRNHGTKPLTSAVINYRIDEESWQTFTWTGHLASFAVDTLFLPAMESESGTHTFTYFTNTPNGLADGNEANNYKSIDFSITREGTSTPFQYGFEATTFPPTHWAFPEDNNLIPKISRTTDAAKSGIAAMKMDRLFTQWDASEIIMESFKLTSTIQPQLTFELAYRMRYDPEEPPYYADTLQVLVSVDCGATWIALYKKTTHELATVPDIILADYIPETADWRQETIDLAAYQSANKLLIKFSMTSNWGGLLYIDDVDISGTPTGKPSVFQNQKMQIFPNPNNGRFTLNIDGITTEKHTIVIRNLLGQIVFTKHLTSSQQKNVPIDHLKKGVYLVSLKNEFTHQMTTEKVVVY